MGVSESGHKFTGTEREDDTLGSPLGFIPMDDDGAEILGQALEVDSFVGGVSNEEMLFHFERILGVERASREVPSDSRYFIGPDILAKAIGVVRRIQDENRLALGLKPGEKVEVSAKGGSYLRPIVSENNRVITVDELTELTQILVRKVHEETGEHQGLAAELALTIAKKMGLSGDFCKVLRWGGLLHDVGKLHPPITELVSKSGILSKEERKIVNEHAEIGYLVLLVLGVPNDIAMIALGHHERVDGSGYPLGLPCSQISTAQRIMAVADVFEALTADRTYSPAKSLIDVLRIMNVFERGKYDLEIYAVLLDLIIEAGIDLASVDKIKTEEILRMREELIKNSAHANGTQGEGGAMGLDTTAVHGEAAKPV